MLPKKSDSALRSFELMEVLAAAMIVSGVRVFCRTIRDFWMKLTDSLRAIRYPAMIDVG